MSLTLARKKLRALASKQRASSSARFFKTGPGEYGEGDEFIGVSVPNLRKLAKEFKALPLSDVQLLLQSAIHEERHLALLILVNAVAKSSPAQHKEIYGFYLANTKHINNWDLVDCSAPHIVGSYLFLHARSRAVLTKLAKSSSLWERRIAIVATQYFIRENDFADTLSLSKLLLADKEDLLHKAVGWMLREAGDRDQPALTRFLQTHAARMPRTMLRYAIEHFSPIERKEFMELGK